LTDGAPVFAARPRRGFWTAAQADVLISIKTLRRNLARRAAVAPAQQGAARRRWSRRWRRRAIARRRESG